MTAVRFTGRDVKILWLCALTGLVTITGYTRVSTPGAQARAAQTELAASPSSASQDASVAPKEDAARSALAFYLQLHETRDADMSGLPRVANACSGVAR